MRWLSVRLAPRALSGTRRLDHLEVLPLDLSQLVQVLDPAVGSDRDAPVATVVGDKHAVFFESLQDRLRVRRVARDIEVGAANRKRSPIRGRLTPVLPLA